MIIVDTSVLVDSLTGARRSAHLLRSAIDSGERLRVPSLVLYEWLRGPRIPSEIAVQETLFPSETVILFGPREAELSAQFYKSLVRARGREVDLAIAACAVVRDADLWTLSPRDFEDIPKVRLWAHHGLS